jgi:hypothetical protein
VGREGLIGIGGPDGLEGAILRQRGDRRDGTGKGG